VQPHLRKCFDAVQKLEFGGPASATAMDIIAMFSPEEERVALTKGLKTRGNVEEWLGRVEEAMFNSLKRTMRNCLMDWHSMAREEWIQKFPSQVISHSPPHNFNCTFSLFWISVYSPFHN
jgi:dynein heavy chain